MKDGDTMRVKGAALAFCVLIGATAPGAEAAPQQSDTTKAERPAAQRQPRKLKIRTTTPITNETASAHSVTDSVGRNLSPWSA